MLDSTIPRNELGVLLLATELVFLVIRSTPRQIECVQICTDSKGALCWVGSDTHKMEVFVLNRVVTIRRMLKWCVAPWDNGLSPPHLPAPHFDGISA